MDRYRTLRDQMLRVSETLEDGNIDKEITRKELEELAVTLGQLWKHPTQITAEHARIVTCLFRKLVNGSRGIEPISFLCDLYGDLRGSLGRLTLLCDLIERGMVACDERRSWKRERSPNRWGPRIAPSSLVDTEITLSDDVISCLLNGSRANVGGVSRPFRSNPEFLNGWFHYVELLSEARVLGARSAFRSDPEHEALAARSQLESRSHLTRRRFPFQRLCDKLALSHNEQVAVIYILLESLRGRSASADEIRALIKKPRWDSFGPHSPLSENGRLLREGVSGPHPASCRLPPPPAPWCPAMGG